MRKLVDILEQDFNIPFPEKYKNEDGTPDFMHYNLYFFNGEWTNVCGGSDFVSDSYYQRESVYKLDPNHELKMELSRMIYNAKHPEENNGYTKSEAWAKVNELKAELIKITSEERTEETIKCIYKDIYNKSKYPVIIY